MAVHSKKNDLGKRLAATTTPVFVVDVERRVVAFNAGCEHLTGWPAEDVLGRTCHYASHNSHDVEALVSSLCPPPEAFAGQELNVAAYVTQRAGFPPAPHAALLPVAG